MSLFNASNPEEGFLAAGGQLDQLLGVCGRVTLYCDEDDFALQSCEQMTRRGRSIGRRVQPIPAAESRVDIVNCTAMEANVAYIRHSYFELNVHWRLPGVADDGVPRIAAQSPRLRHTWAGLQRVLFLGAARFRLLVEMPGDAQLQHSSICGQGLLAQRAVGCFSRDCIREAMRPLATLVSSFCLCC